MYLLLSIISTIDATLATMMTFINIVFFIFFTKFPLLPSYAVYSIGFYYRLSVSVGFMFTRAFVQCTNMKVSLNRIRDFLILNELEDKRKFEEGTNLAVRLENFSFKWKEADEFALRDVSLTVNKGKLEYCLNLFTPYLKFIEKL